MKTNIFKQARPLWIGIILWLPLIGGCTETELNESDTVPISQVAEDTRYTSLPLIGTQWKLIGFVDSSAETIKLAEPSGGNSYTVVFEENGKISGYTSTNAAQGQYSVGNSLLSIPFFQNVTELNEVFDGLHYIESMTKVSSFDISTKGLALHHEAGKHMLFKPFEPVE